MRVFLLTLCCFFGLLLSAQGRLEGGLYAEHFQVGYRGQQSFGGMLHVPLGDRFTANYQLSVGPAMQGGWFVHAPAGAVAGTWMLTHSGDLHLLSTIGIFCFVLPEGVGMYVNEGKLLSHISINPLGFEYWYTREPYEEFAKMSCSVVFRMKMRPKFPFPVYVAPQVAGTMIYTPGEMTDRFGVRVGVTIGMEEE